MQYFSKTNTLNVFLRYGSGFLCFQSLWVFAEKSQRFIIFKWRTWFKNVFHVTRSNKLRRVQRWTGDAPRRWLAWGRRQCIACRTRVSSKSWPKSRGTRGEPRAGAEPKRTLGGIGWDYVTITSADTHTADTRWHADRESRRLSHLLSSIVTSQFWMGDDGKSRIRCNTFMLSNCYSNSKNYLDTE